MVPFLGHPVYQLHIIGVLNLLVVDLYLLCVVYCISAVLRDRLLLVLIIRRLIEPK